MKPSKELKIGKPYTWKTRFIGKGHVLQIKSIKPLDLGGLQIAVINTTTGFEYVAFENDLIEL